MVTLLGISLTHPEYFLLVLVSTAIVGASYFFYLYRTYKFYRDWGKVSGAIVGQAKLLLRNSAITAAFFLLGIVLLGPHRQEIAIKEEGEPMEIQFLIDCSLSMLAEDAHIRGFAKPLSRLEAVKLQVENFMKPKPANFEELLKEGWVGLEHDQIGLVAFADMGLRIVAIPTKDYDRFLTTFRRLDKNYVTMGIPQGSNIWDGIGQALENSSPENENLKTIMVILSDGEQQAEENYIVGTQKKTLKLLSERNPDLLQIFVIGVGDPTRDTPIPRKKDANGNVLEYYVQEEEGPEFGQIIWTRPRPDYLMTVAYEIGGKYIEAANADDLIQLLTSIVKTERTVIRTVKIPILKDISQYLIMTALALFVGAIIIKI